MSLSQVPLFEEYSMRGRTYRYFAGKPLYGFGFGLSYTSFAYSNLKITPLTVKSGNSVTVEGDVKNTGAMAGDEVVEIYLTQPNTFETPLRVLAGFQRVHLGPGESTHVSLKIDPRSLGQVDEKGDRVIVPGEYSVSLAGAQPQEAASVQTGKFQVADKTELPK